MSLQFEPMSVVLTAIPTALQGSQFAPGSTGTTASALPQAGFLNIIPYQFSGYTGDTGATGVTGSSFYYGVTGPYVYININVGSTGVIDSLDYFFHTGTTGTTGATAPDDDIGASGTIVVNNSDFFNAFDYSKVDASAVQAAASTFIDAGASFNMSDDQYSLNILEASLSALVVYMTMTTTDPGYTTPSFDFMSNVLNGLPSGDIASFAYLYQDYLTILLGDFFSVASNLTGIQPTLDTAFSNTVLNLSAFLDTDSPFTAGGSPPANLEELINSAVDYWVSSSINNLTFQLAVIQQMIGEGDFVTQDQLNSEVAAQVAVAVPVAVEEAIIGYEFVTDAQLTDLRTSVNSLAANQQVIMAALHISGIRVSSS